MDFSYDWLLAQIRHDLNKFLLFFITYFPCFGPNKKNLKCRNKLNFIVSTCRSFGCPPYSHVKNVPALVSHDIMEGKQHTNKPKAMEDDDATLSEGLASTAAVAPLEMETCQQGDAPGTQIMIEGVHIKTQELIATPQDTKVSVKNLFFNLPARRNFYGNREDGHLSRTMSNQVPY